MSAARLPTSLPTAELPVNVSMSRSGLAVSACPVSMSPGTTDSTPSGRPGLGEHLGERVGGQRCLGGGLEHHGAAGQQRRAQLVDRKEQRHVPRDDRADHAHRLTATRSTARTTPLRVSVHFTSSAAPAKKLSAPIEPAQCIVSMMVCRLTGLEGQQVA